MTPSMIEDNKLIKDQSRYYYCIEDSINNNHIKKAILKDNDIVIRLMGDFRWYKHSNSKFKIIPNANMAIIRTNRENAINLELFFESATGQDYLKQQADLFSRGETFTHLSISDLQQFIVPTEEVLESAHKYESIKNTVFKIADAFEKAGWEVKYSRQEYEGDKTIFDIALFNKGILKGAIEVKNVRYRDLSSKNMLRSQFERNQKLLNIEYIFLFVENELFLYRDGELTRLPEIPSPDFVSVEYLSEVYEEEINDSDSIPVKNLPNNAISLSDRYILEKILKNVQEVNTRMVRMEEKIDDINKIVREIVKQISSYQSLVERQLEREIEPSEVERIIQSFVDECSEKIVSDVKRNCSEIEYNIEEKKLIASLGKSAWNKLDETSRTFLISSKLMYNNLLSIGNAVDYSGVCLLVTKALEVEMSKRFCEQFIAYLNSKYPGKDNLENWPTALLDRLW